MPVYPAGATTHAALTDVNTPHLLAELEAAVCSETEADTKVAAEATARGLAIATHAGLPNEHHTPPNPGIWTFLSEESPSSAATQTVSFSAYDLIYVLFSLAMSLATQLRLRLNGVSAAEYGERTISGTTISTATGRTFFTLAETYWANNHILCGAVLIQGRRGGSSDVKGIRYLGTTWEEGYKILINGCLAEDNADLTSVVFYPANGTFTGKIEVFGRNL